MVEKERKKDLGKVVTGGGEGTEAEGTEKANHRGHGGHGEKQTTEETEVEKRERKRWAAPTRHSIGLSRGRWVGRARKRQTTEDTEDTEETNHGGHGGHGGGKEGGGHDGTLLHGAAG